MTLILGSRSQEHILLSADGLSTSVFNGERFVGRTTLQKLFNFGLIAIGHCGDNWLKLDGKNLGMKEFLHCWYKVGIPKRTDDAMSSFRQYVAENVSSTASSGFWIAAFDERRGPECQRIEAPHWQLARFQDAQFKCGDGSQFVPDEWSSDIDAFEVAIERQEQTGSNVFGGHFHQLRVTKDGCSWVEPWQDIGLGAAEILPELQLSQEKIDSPQKCVLDDMNRLKDELWRSNTAGGRRRPGLGKIRAKWEADPVPDWRYVYQLVAIGDEAEHAGPTEVVEADALLYRAHVEQITASLPSNAPRATP